MELFYLALSIFATLYFVDSCIRLRYKTDRYGVIYVNLLRESQENESLKNKMIGCYHCSITLGRFFCEDILNDLYLNDELAALKQKILTSGLNKEEYNIAFKKAFIDIMSNLRKPDDKNCDDKEIQDYLNDTLMAKYDSYLAFRDKDGVLNNSQQLYEHQASLYNIYWGVFNDMRLKFPSYISKIIKDKMTFISSLYTDTNLKSKYNGFFKHTFNYRYAKNQTKESDCMFAALKQKFDIKESDLVNFILDITCVCIEFFIENSQINHNIYPNTLKNFSRTKFTSSFLKFVSECINDIFEENTKHNNDTNGIFTIVFDTITFIENLELNYSIPLKVYPLVIQALDEISKNVNIIIFESWKKHETKGTLEIINLTDQLKLKVMNHKNTDIFNTTLLEKQHKSVSDALNLLLLSNQRSSSAKKNRRLFSSRIIEKIIDACVEANEHTETVNEIQKMVEPYQSEKSNTLKGLFTFVYDRIKTYQESRVRSLPYSFQVDADESRDYKAATNSDRKNKDNSQNLQGIVENKESKSDDTLQNTIQSNLSLNLNSSLNANKNTNAEFEFTKYIGTQTTSFSKAKGNKTEKPKTNKLTSKQILLAKIKEEKDNIRANKVQ